MMPDGMEAVQTDIRDLNGGVLKALTNREQAAWARSHWGVHDKVVAQVRRAKLRQIERIARCGVPIFRVRVPDRPRAHADAVPEAMAHLHLWALLSVARAGWINELAAAALFRAPTGTVARLRAWPLRTIRDTAYHHADVLQLGRPVPTAFWRHAMHGAQVGGGAGERLIRTLLQMGTD